MRKEKHIEELEWWMHEFDCTLREAALDELYHYYEAAGFDSEILDEEFSSLSDSELVERFKEIF